MALNIHIVQEDLAQSNWKLLSEQYKNLKTPLKMVCPNGHEQEQTYEKWRKYRQCPECFKTDRQKIKDEVLKKQQGAYRVLGLDLATHTSGFALYENQELIHYGAYTVPDSNEAAERIHSVIEWLDKVIQEWQPDVIGIEDIQLQENDWAQYNVSAFKMLANLQGAVQEFLYSKNHSFAFCSVNSWRNYCAIGGKNRTEKKRLTQQKIFEMYGLHVGQDEADAICIGKYFANYFKKPVKQEIDWSEDIWQ